MSKHPPHLLVGLCGAAGSGKTTLARSVQERLRLGRFSRPVTILKFAGPIRTALRVWGVEKGDWPGEVAHPDFRAMAQWLGDGMRSKFGKDFWVQQLLREVGGLSSPTVVLIDDVRYGNEAEQCDLVVRLMSNRDAGLTPEQMVHPSEQGWTGFACNLQLAMNEKAQIDANADRIEAEIVERMKR